MKRLCYLMLGALLFLPLVSVANITPNPKQSTNDVSNPLKFYGQLDGSWGLANIGKSQVISWEPPMSTLCDTFSKENGYRSAFALGLQLGLAKKVSPKTLMELGLELNQTSNYQAEGKIYGGPKTLSNYWYDYKYKAHMFRGMLVGRLFYQFSSTFRPFLALGAGLARDTVSSLDVTRISNAAPVGPYYRQFTGKTVNNFAWQAGAGVNYQVNEHTGVILGYRYVDFGSASLSDMSSAKKLRVGAIEANEIYLGIHIVG